MFGCQVHFIVWSFCTPLGTLRAHGQSMSSRSVVYGLARSIDGNRMWASNRHQPSSTNQLTGHPGWTWINSLHQLTSINSLHLNGFNRYSLHPPMLGLVFFRRSRAAKGFARSRDSKLEILGTGGRWWKSGPGNCPVPLVKFAGWRIRVHWLNG